LKRVARLLSDAANWLAGVENVIAAPVSFILQPSAKAVAEYLAVGRRYTGTPILKMK